MAADSRWGTTPRQSIERECRRRGKDDVVDGCRRLIRHDAVDPALLLALGGPGADKFLDGRPHADTYCLRVWGLRGLLWAWDDAAMPEVLLALADDACEYERWRSRSSPTICSATSPPMPTLD